MKDTTHFHVVLAEELAIRITLDRKDAEMGMSVKERDGKFYAVIWQLEGGELVEGQELPIERENSYDIVLHPRAKREILDTLHLKQSAETDSIVSLYDLTEALRKER